MAPYEYIYAKYENDCEDVEELYETYEFNGGSVFRGVDRLKLIYGIIAAKQYENGCNLDIYKMSKEGALLGFFPLHDHVELHTLEEKWLQFIQLPWNQPTDEIKNYFGEKIGLYFLWLGHYTSWLSVAAVVGFFCWINIAADDNDPNAVIMPYFASFIAFWATLFLEFWKRKEFVGEKRPSPVTGKEYLYFPRNEEQQRLCQTSIVIFGFILVVIGAVTAIFILKITLNQISALVVGSVQMGSIIASIANALLIQVMNILYGDVAIQLTDYENH
ncbi:Ano4, partial [Symbiodinium microadriaticum]